MRSYQKCEGEGHGENTNNSLYAALTMCPQPKAMSFALVRQIGQACIEEGKG